MRSIDPSGHLTCSDPHVAPGDCTDDPQHVNPHRYVNDVAGNWSQANLGKLKLALFTIGTKLAAELGGDMTPYEAYRTVYGNNMTLTWCGGTTDGICKELTAWAWAYSPNDIAFGRFYSGSAKAIGHIIHEHGHIFDRKVCAATPGCDPDYVSSSGMARWDLSEHMDFDCTRGYCLARDGHTSDLGKHYGFAGGLNTWQFNPANEEGEIFADMYVGWVGDSWENSLQGISRQQYMNVNMSGYLSLITGIKVPVTGVIKQGRNHAVR